MKFVRIFLAFDENELATQCTMLAFKKKKNFNEKNGNDHREDHVLEKTPRTHWNSINVEMKFIDKKRL